MNDARRRDADAHGELEWVRARLDRLVVRRQQGAFTAQVQFEYDALTRREAELLATLRKDEADNEQ